MMRKTFAFAVMAIAFSSMAFAQTQASRAAEKVPASVSRTADRVLYDSPSGYELVERANPWNRGRNINGLRLGSTTVSYAELYGGYEAGGFRRESEAASAWKSGALAESILHLEKMSMKGLFSFEHYQGKDMCGSMFVKQDHYPINVFEFVPGTKTLQKYAFEGGLTYDIAPFWKIGGEMAFTSMNYSKRKDLRHTTYLLDLDVAPSLLYSKGDWQVGASYLFHKNSESVKAQQIGESAEEYKVFLDKGLHYGAYEQWEGNGVHLKEPGVDGLPIRELSQGVALQWGWTDHRRRGDSFYMDVEYRHSSGKAGEKDFIWFEFPGEHVSAFAQYRYCRPKAHHFFRLEGSFQYLENHENALEKQTEGGITNAQVYGSNLIFSQEKYALGTEYELDAKRFQLRADLNFGAVKEISSQLFPYICTNLSKSVNAGLDGTFRLWHFDLGASLDFSKSFIREEERLVAETGGALPPIRVESHYKQWWEYANASKLRTGFFARYDLWQGLYVQISGTYLRAFGLDKSIFQHAAQLTSPDRWQVNCRFGYSF